MDYQILKQLRDDLISEIQDRNFQEKKIVCTEDYDLLVCFLDEYEELTRKMLQYIKEKDNFSNETNLEQHFSLGK